MTQNERNKLYIARCLLDGKMTISEAAVKILWIMWISLLITDIKRLFYVPNL